MRMCKKRALSFILTLALIVGSFAGTGMTVKAFTDVTDVTGPSEPLESDGGEVTIVVEGTDWAADQQLWYVLQKKEGDTTVTVGENVNTITVNGGNTAEIKLTIPPNTSVEDIEYTIKVKYEEPSSWALNPWQGAATAKFKIKGKEGGTPVEANKTALSQAIDEARAKDEALYSPDTWQALQAQLSEAQRVYDKTDATQKEVDDATEVLNNAIKNLKEKQANITKMTVSKDTVPAEESEVTLQIEGTDLKADNWGVKAEKYFEGTDYTASTKAGKVTVKEINENSATLKIGKNTLKNGVDIKIEAGPVEDGEIKEIQQTLKISQSGNKKVAITIQAVDKDGNAIQDPEVKLGITDSSFNKEGNAKSLTDGSLEVSITDFNPLTYTVDIHSSVLGYKAAAPIVFKTNNQYEITEVDGKPYDGNPVKLTVLKEESDPVQAANITSITGIPSAIPVDGTDIELTVDGENLTTENWGVKVEKYKKGTTELAGQQAGTASAYNVSEEKKATVSIDANYFKDDVDVKIIVGAKNKNGIEPQQTALVTQAGNKKAYLIIKLVDKNTGANVSESGLSLCHFQEGYEEDMGFPAEPLEKDSETGGFIFEPDADMTGTYIIKLAKNDLGYEMDPFTVKINPKYVIERVNGNSYDGTPQKITVTKKQEVTQDKSGLDTVIKEAEAKKAEDYVADANWTAMQARLNEAKAVYNNTAATEKEISDAVKNLSDALKAIVKKGTESEETELTAISLTPEILECTGGTVKVTAAGTNLKGTLWYQVRKQTELINGSPVYDTGAEIQSVSIDDSADPSFSITIPANSDKEDAKYQVRATLTKPVGAVLSAAKSAILTVKGRLDDTPVKVDKTGLKAKIDDAQSRAEGDYEADGKWANLQEKLEAALTVYGKEDATVAEVAAAEKELQDALDALVKKTVNITNAKAEPTQIPANGGTVKLDIEGTNLTKTNWGIEVKRFISGTDQTQEASNMAGQAEVKEITEKGAVVEISANGMKSDVDFVFIIGPKEGSAVTKQKEVIVTQAAKTYSTVSIEPQSVILADEHTVVMEFKEDAPAISMVEGADLKKLVYIAGANGENCYDLTDEGKVTVDNQKVIVTFAQTLEKIDATSKLYIKEGVLSAVEKEDGKDVVKVLKEIGWLIQTTARISNITVDKNLFDKNGGTVTATLNGYKVEEIALDKIETSLYLPGETSATDIEIKKAKGEDEKPTLTFTVPANTSANTVSYWLNVKYDGTPVYESAADSRGQRTTISVLPEGKTAADRTLSMVTISGNNKTEVNNTRDIEVQVSSNVGELKTELRVYGTNLDSSLTKVRAVDENGIVWPVYQISECDGTWRFIAIAGPHRNGVFGDGNSQLIELLPPRYAGTNKTYKIQVAIDGKNFIEEPCVTLKVINENISGEYDFRDCTDKNFKYVTVNYVDESGKAIAEKDVYKGYCISMPEGFGIAPKKIDGYTLVKEPTLHEWVEEGRTYDYVYKKTVVAPVTPVTPVTPKDVKVSSIRLSAVSKNIAAGKKLQLKAEVLPANAANKAVTYKSSNTKYATVNASGKVTLKKAGAGKTVTITATAADGSKKSASYKIKIMKNAVKSVKVKGAKAVKAGKKLKLKAAVKTTGKKVNKKLKWTSSNTKYATVSSGGVVKTKKAGKGKRVKITAAATDGSNKKSTVKIKIK